MMDVGVLQKSMRNCFIKASVETDEQKNQKMLKREKAGIAVNSTDLLSCIVKCRVGSSGRTAQHAFTFGLI